MDCSMPGFPVLGNRANYFPKFAQTHVPLSRWCHPIISSFVVPFSCLQSFPASRSFPVSRLFPSGGQSTRVSASASVLPMNMQGWFPLGLTGLSALQSKTLSKSFIQCHSSKASVLQHPAAFVVQLSHPYMTTGKTIALTVWTFVSKVMSLLFNMLSRLVIAFLPRSLLILWRQSPSTVISPLCFPIYALKWWDQMPWSLFFKHWVLSQPFHFPSSSVLVLITIICWAPPLNLVL